MLADSDGIAESKRRKRIEGNQKHNIRMATVPISSIRSGGCESRRMAQVREKKTRLSDADQVLNDVKRSESPPMDMSVSSMVTVRGGINRSGSRIGPYDYLEGQSARG